MFRWILESGGSARSDESPRDTQGVFGFGIFVKGVAFVG